MRRHFGCLLFSLVAIAAALGVAWSILGGGYYYDDHTRQLTALLSVNAILLVAAIALRHIFYNQDQNLE